MAVAPESYQVHMLKGLVEARMSHLSDAENTYARAVELNPKAPEALLALALVESANEKRRQSQPRLKKLSGSFRDTASFIRSTPGCCSNFRRFRSGSKSQSRFATQECAGV